MIPNYKIKEKRKRRQSFSQEIIENGSFYIFKTKGFLKNKKRLFEVHIFKKKYGFEIDDLEFNYNKINWKIFKISRIYLKFFSVHKSSQLSY